MRRKRAVVLLKSNKGNNHRNNHGNDSITAFVSQIITTATTEGLSKSSSTNGHPHHPTALLVAVITALLASRRGVWMMQSVRSLLRLLASASSWYLNRLEVSPLLTKCLTGGIIALIGDYGAQWFEYKPMKSRSVGPVVAVAVEAAGGLAAEAVSSSSLDNELAAASLLLRAGA